jgi:hypothetical protein
MNHLFPDVLESIPSESEDAHVATFYMMQALTRLHFPEAVSLTRAELETIHGDPRYHVPYEEREICLWSVPVEIPVFPPRNVKSRLPAARQVAKPILVTKHKTFTDISRLGFDMSYIQSFVFVPVTRLGFDCQCLH